MRCCNVDPRRAVGPQIFADYADYEVTKIGKYKFNRGQRKAILRHAQNEDNLRHLLEGGFGFKYDRYARVEKMSADELNKILDILTSAEKEYAGVPVDKLFNKQGVDLNKL